MKFPALTAVAFGLALIIGASAVAADKPDDKGIVKVDPDEPAKKAGEADKPKGDKKPGFVADNPEKKKGDEVDSTKKPSSSTAVEKCRDIAVRIPSVKKPANLWLTVMDDRDGFIKPFKDCNDSAEAKDPPGVTTAKTILLRVTQGTDQWARFSVPNDESGERLIISYTHVEDGKQLGQWLSEPLRKRNRVILDAAPEGKLKVVGAKS